MRSVTLRVSGKPKGSGRTWAYPNGQALGYFKISVYEITVAGTATDGQASTTKFDVFRFGVHCLDGKTASVVGLAEHQVHVIKAWLPTYKVHSARSTEDGAWQVYGNFLVHDGPDSAAEVFATIGCIEIMGPSGFVKFNDLIISLAGPSAKTRDEQLLEIGKSGKISIIYESAERPALQRWP
jgi:hypothetical protein